MTKQELMKKNKDRKTRLLAKLEKYANRRRSSLDRDTENAHYDADMALLTFINDPEITEAYDNVDRWYS